MNAASSHAPAARRLVLRTFGALDLQGGDVAALQQLLARPKPIALLTYLAIGGEVFRRRDSLLALLWPASDTDHARSSLRQAIYQLRRCLGDHVVATRGEEIGLVPGTLSCDAIAFTRCIERGDGAGALALYRGELLPGFYVDGAPEFERWLDARRRHYRDEASSSARGLAEAAEGAGDIAGAVEWSRREVAIAPDDEAVMRRLTRLEKAITSPGPVLDLRRVLVAVFENRTTIGELDAFGGLVADVIAQGVSMLPDVQVVPLTAALVAAHTVGSGTEQASLVRVASESGAATLVSGTYYAAGDQLVVQGWIGDTRSGTILRALGPARAPLSSPMASVDMLRDEACTALAVHLETRIPHTRAAGYAPAYDAYCAYIEGLTRFVDGDWRGALHHLDQAATRDAGYALPLLVSAISRWNLAELDDAQAAADRAAPLVSQGGPFERALLDMVRSWLAGDWGAACDAVRRQAELAPGSIPSFQLAQEARRRNRPREAVRILSALDPMRGELRGWFFYWVELAQSLHLLGDHVQELEVALRARAIFRDNPLILRLELHARAALGDHAGVVTCIEESLTHPGHHGPTPGVLLREASLELRAHGHGGVEAETLLRQSLAWYDELSSEERSSPAYQRALARARYEVGDLSGAASLFSRIAGEGIAVSNCESIHHAQLQAHLDIGYLGAIAIRTGNVAEGARIESLLAASRGRHLFGSNHYWRAIFAVLREETVVAASLLRRAFAGGMPMETFIHRDPHFESVRVHPEISSLLRPRG